MVIRDCMRAAGQKHSGKKAYIQTEGVLMQEAILHGKLDIAQTEVGFAASGVIKSSWQGCRQLEIGSRAVVKIDAGLTARSVARGRPVVKGVDLEVLILGRLRIIRQVGRPGKSGLDQRNRH